MVEEIKKNRWNTAQFHEKEYWDYVKAQISGQNENRIKEYWGWYLKLFGQCVDLNNKTKILEIGSGPVGIINYINNCEKYALDPLMDYYTDNFKLSKEVRWLQGIGEDIPFEDDYFDAVISTNTLDHTFNPLAVLKDIKRVLKNQGFLFLTVDCHQPFLKRYREIKEIFKKGDKLHPFSFSVRDVKNLIKKAGLQIISAQRGIGDIGVYAIKELPAQKPAFLKRISLLYEKGGVVVIIDAVINKILIFFGEKMTKERDKIDFIFIARKQKHV